MKKQLIGVSLIIISLFMLMGFFKADLEAGIMVWVLALTITVVLPLTGGSYLIYSHYKRIEVLLSKKNDLRLKTSEAEILKLAQKKGGKLTVVEVMSDLAMSKEEAQDILQSMSAQSLADVCLTDSGVIVYAFYEIQNLKDKQKSKGVLDV